MSPPFHAGVYAEKGLWLAALAGVLIGIGGLWHLAETRR
jgi:hypothetical protein